MSEYEESTQSEQIALLEEFARDVLEQYDIKPISLESINHAFNSTFKVTDADQNVYAMRINTNSKKWPRQVEAEVQWLHELAKLNLVAAPVPIANLQGELFSNHYFYYLGTNLNVLLYRWIEGDVVRKDPTPELLFELGRTMATLHQHGRTWLPTGEGVLPRIDTPLMVKTDHLFGEVDERISPELYKSLHEVNVRTIKLFESLNERTEAFPIHADLHFGNVIWHENKMSILDFDDCGIGFPLQDLAITLFYIRDTKVHDQHLFDGYSSVAPLPEFEPWELELLMAARGVALLNYLSGTTSADDAAYIPTYLANTEKRLNHYLETGEFILFKS